MVVAALSAAGLSIAGQSQEATITQVVKDVQLLPPQATVRPAVVNDRVGEGCRVLTGADSRAELIFEDQTVARLSASSIFGFKGVRNLDLGDGAVLLQVPRSVKGAKITASGVSAAVTGITGMFESHPGVYKFLVLEGTGRVYRRNHLGDSVLVRAGQMVIGDPNSPVSDPVDFDIGRFLQTSQLIINFAPLPSETLMAQESQKQRRAKSRKTLIDTNLVIFGGGTLVSVLDPRHPAGTDRAVSQSPSPTPAPTAISSIKD